MTSARVSGFMKAPPPVPSTTAVFLQQPGDDLGLAGAEIGFAVGREDVLDAHAGRFFHLFVAIDEVAAEAACQPAADGGLAGAHHAHQHDRPAAEPRQQVLAPILAGGNAFA